MGKLFWLQFAISEASELASVVVSAESAELTPPEETALQAFIVACTNVANAFTGNPTGSSVLGMQEKLKQMQASQTQGQATTANPGPYRPGMTQGPR